MSDKLSDDELERRWQAFELLRETSLADIAALPDGTIEKDLAIAHHKALEKVNADWALGHSDDVNKRQVAIESNVSLQLLTMIARRQAQNDARLSRIESGIRILIPLVLALLAVFIFQQI